MKVLASFTYKDKHFTKGARIESGALPDSAEKEAIKKKLIEKPKAKKGK